MTIKKICTGCDEKGRVEKRTKWVKKLGRKNHPPRTFMPSIDELISVDIKMGEDHAGKYVFYFAAESKDMLRIDGKLHQNRKPHEAYDDFENKGVCQLDDSGFCRVILSKPINYHVVEEGNKTYKPHLHFKLSTKSGQWSKTNYTLQI